MRLGSLCFTCIDEFKYLYLFAVINSSGGTVAVE